MQPKTVDENYLNCLDPWERCQISACWHYLEETNVDIGRLGDNLNQLVIKQPQELKKHLKNLREHQNKKNHWVTVKTIDKAIALCKAKQA